MFIGNTFVFFAFQGKDKIDSSTRQIVVWTLSVIAGVGLVVMVFFPKPPSRVAAPLSGRSDEKSIEVGQSTTSDVAVNSVWNAFKGAVSLFLTQNMLLLCITFVYTGQFIVMGCGVCYNCHFLGLELGFWSGVYGNCISFTENLPNRKQLVGISGIFIGLGEVIGKATFIRVLYCTKVLWGLAGAAFGLLGKRTTKWGRDPIVILGFVLHIISFFVIFLNIPNKAPFGETSDKAFITSNTILAILCSFFLGFGDACYNTQIFSMLGGVYADDSASAFAIFKFTQVSKLASFVH